MKRSKKQSDSNAQPETVFFVDRDLGRQFAEALSRAGLRIELHDSHFGPETADEEWLAAVSQKGWVVLTHDAKIRHNSRAKLVVQQAGARVIVVKGKVEISQVAAGFVRTLPRVLRFLRKHEPPFIAKQYRNVQQPNKAGTVELWFGKERIAKFRRSL